jgi:hypothetical protein
VDFRRWLCRVLHFLKLHASGCEHCDLVQKCWGTDLRERLKKLE